MPCPGVGHQGAGLCTNTMTEITYHDNSHSSTRNFDLGHAEQSGADIFLKPDIILKAMHQEGKEAPTYGSVRHISILLHMPCKFHVLKSCCSHTKPIMYKLMHVL